MKLFLPAFSCTLFTGCDLLLLRSFRVCSTPFVQRLRMLISHMLGVTGIQVQVLRMVVATLVVFVVDAFLWAQKATDDLFHYKSMLKHIAIRVGVRMVRCVDVDVAGGMNSSSALPVWSGYTSRRLVSEQIPNVLPFVITTPRLCLSGYWRQFTTAALTFSIWVNRSLKFPSCGVIRASLRRTGPMPWQKSVTWSSVVTTPAVTEIRGAVSNRWVFHDCALAYHSRKVQCNYSG